MNYTYDGDGDRLQKSNGKIYWYGAGSQILDESDASGNITDEYIYFGGKRIAHRVVSSNTFYFYVDDLLGSSRALATSAGAMCFDADFYPYGGEHDYTNTCPQNYKFTGKERDPETNNDDFDARYYSSAYGRFLSADWSSTPSPVPYANLTNPQTLNLYAMAHDNPETFVDLDGHCDWCQKIKNYVVYGEYATDKGLEQALAKDAVKMDLFRNYIQSQSKITNSQLNAMTNKEIADVANQLRIEEAEGITGDGSGASLFPDPEQIANGHSWDKHKDEFPGATKEDFEQKIGETVRDAKGSDVKQLADGRTAYWNDKEQMVVIHDPHNADGGTAFRPTNGRGYFNSLR